MRNVFRCLFRMRFLRFFVFGPKDPQELFSYSFLPKSCRTHVPLKRRVFERQGPELPRAAQEDTERSQEHPKSTQDAPKATQEDLGGSKSNPRAPQEAPRPPQEHHTRPRELPKTVPGPPKVCLLGCFYPILRASGPPSPNPASAGHAKRL